MCLYPSATPLGAVCTRVMSFAQSLALKLRNSKAAEDLLLEDVRETGREIDRGAYGIVIEVEIRGTRYAGKKPHDFLLKEDVGYTRVIHIRA